MRKKNSFSAVMRTDLLSSNLTKEKETHVRELLDAYQKGAVLIAKEQWKIFFETGEFNKNHDEDKITFKQVIGSSRRVQMCRYQVVGQLQAWISNRANEFKEIVNGKSETTTPDIKHMLYTINQKQAWFSRTPLHMYKSKVLIPDNIRALARSIMRHVMKKHNRPNLRHTSMWLDSRAADLQKPIKATQDGKIGYWINLSTMTRYHNIRIPLFTYDYHTNRNGIVSKGVQISVDKQTNELKFGVATNIGEQCSISRAAYIPERETLALDFGLTTLFGCDDGSLIGRDWLPILKKYDKRISNIMSGQQQRGRKPRQSARYKKAVIALRGWIKTETNRVINVLIKQKKPAILILEKLDFRNPTLSKDMNRIIQNCGRSVIKTKLQDLDDKFGVKTEEVNAAYTSQACSSCGYVDKRNRPSQGIFKCRWCGNELHADINAARNIGANRVDPVLSSVFLKKGVILTELVRRFIERRVYSTRTGGSGAIADPRASNPYFMERVFGPQALSQVKLI